MESKTTISYYPKVYPYVVVKEDTSFDLNPKRELFKYENSPRIYFPESKRTSVILKASQAELYLQLVKTKITKKINNKILKKKLKKVLVYRRSGKKCMQYIIRLTSSISTNYIYLLH